MGKIGEIVKSRLVFEIMEIHYLGKGENAIRRCLFVSYYIGVIYSVGRTEN